MKMIYILTVVLIVAAIAFFIVRKKAEQAPSDYFIATESESADRVKSLNMDQASEDASYLLDTARLIIPSIAQSEVEEYKADPHREWILDVIPVNGELLEQKDLLNLFDYAWRSDFSSEIYGYSPEEKGWTFAFAADSPLTFEKIQVAVDLLDVLAENPEVNPEILERYYTELQKRVKTYPVKLNVKMTEGVNTALVKGKALAELHDEFEYEAIIVLEGAQAFNGREVWDVLQSVGLKWGDGDLFHWNNPHDYGDDQYFSVYTTTAPTYFLPEEIQAGNMNPETLVFGYSVPRSADPENIFGVMADAVRYAQKRLGGKLLDEHGDLFNEAIEKKKIAEHVAAMKAKGIVAGSETALRMFW